METATNLSVTETFPVRRDSKNNNKVIPHLWRTRHKLICHIFDNTDLRGVGVGVGGVNMYLFKFYVYLYK